LSLWWPALKQPTSSARYIPVVFLIMNAIKQCIYFR
jgi:hypothetical protein